MSQRHRLVSLEVKFNGFIFGIAYTAIYQNKCIDGIKVTVLSRTGALKIGRKNLNTILESKDNQYYNLHIIWLKRTISLVFCSFFGKIVTIYPFTMKSAATRGRYQVNFHRESKTRR